MSVDTSKLDYPILNKLETKILIPRGHFLVSLALVVPWVEYGDLAIADLYRNKKCSGRKLNLRLHLGAFIWVIYQEIHLRTYLGVIESILEMR